MSESVYKKKCVKLMRDRYGAAVIYIHGNQLQEPGLADTFVSTALPFHWQGFMEFKACDGRIRPAQRAQAAKFNKRNPCSSLFIKEYSERSEYDGKGHIVLFDESAERQAMIEIVEFDILEALIRLYRFNNVEVDCSEWERLLAFRIAALQAAGLTCDK